MSSYITIKKTVEVDMSIKDVMEFLIFVNDDEKDSILSELIGTGSSYWDKEYRELFDEAQEKYNPFELRQKLGL